MTPIVTFIHRTGGLLALFILVFIMAGVWRGTRRERGRTTGKSGPWQQSAVFYFAAAAVFIGLAVLGWKRIPVTIPPPVKTGMVIAGSLLYFPGMGLVLWGRLALAENYFVSTSTGAQLFTRHRLVTGGPYAFIRHPMYAGLILAAVGALLIYFTWTALYFAIISPMLTRRIGQEEKLLAEEFGEQWQAYCQRVPALFPKLGRR